MTRIVFVDDEPSILQGIRRMLRAARDLGWELEFFDDARKALDGMATRPCDIVVSDLRMPGMDGVEFLGEVHKSQPGTIRIILSGHADKEVILRSTEHADQFLSKPCDGTLLMSTLKTADRQRQRLGTQGVANLAARLRRVPGLPETYSRIIEELNRPEPDIDVIGKIVASDISMSAQVLHLVNSSFFGLRNPVAKPADAVRVLGTETIRCLALSIGLFEKIEAAPDVITTLKQINTHCVHVGALARRLARQLRLSPAAIDQVTQAGMLHEIGEFAIADSFPDVFRKAHSAAADGKGSVLALERELLGLSYADVGAYMLGVWGLPEVTLTAICDLAVPASITSTELDAPVVLHVAHAIAEAPATGSVEDGLLLLDEELRQRLSLDERFPEWFASLREAK